MSWFDYHQYEMVYPTMENSSLEKYLARDCTNNLSHFRLFTEPSPSTGQIFFVPLLKTENARNTNMQLIFFHLQEHWHFRTDAYFY